MAEEITVKLKVTGAGEINEIIKCFSDEKITDVKKKVEAKLGIAVSSQKLIFMGTILGDEKTLASYDIKNDSCIHVFVSKAKVAATAQSSNVASSATSAPAAVAAAAADIDQSIATIRAQNNVEAAIETIRVLIKFCDNIINSPHEAKYRKLKKDNAIFSRKVLNISGGPQAMLSIGFVDMGDSYELVANEAAWNKLVSSRATLSNVYNSMELMSNPFLGGGFPGASPFGAPGFNPSQTPNLNSMMSMMNDPMMAQMMNDPAMMQMAQQMMSNGNNNPLGQSPFGLGGMNNMGMGMGGPNPQAMAQMQQQLMSNPQAMAQVQQMMSNPMMQQQMRSMMSNPEQLRQVVQMMRSTGMGHGLSEEQLMDMIRNMFGGGNGFGGGPFG